MVSTMLQNYSSLDFKYQKSFDGSLRTYKNFTSRIDQILDRMFDLYTDKGPEVLLLG